MLCSSLPGYTLTALCSHSLASSQTQGRCREQRKSGDGSTSTSTKANNHAGADADADNTANASQGPFLQDCASAAHNALHPASQEPRPQLAKLPHNMHNLEPGSAPTSPFTPSAASAASTLFTNNTNTNTNTSSSGSSTITTTTTTTTSPAASFSQPAAAACCSPNRTDEHGSTEPNAQTSAATAQSSSHPSHHAQSTLACVRPSPPPPLRAGPASVPTTPSCPAPSRGALSPPRGNDTPCSIAALVPAATNTSNMSRNTVSNDSSDGLHNSKTSTPIATAAAEEPLLEPPRLTRVACGVRVATGTTVPRVAGLGTGLRVLEVIQGGGPASGGGRTVCRCVTREGRHVAAKWSDAVPVDDRQLLAALLAAARSSFVRHGDGEAGGGGAGMLPGYCRSSAANGDGEDDELCVHGSSSSWSCGTTGSAAAGGFGVACRAAAGGGLAVNGQGELLATTAGGRAVERLAADGAEAAHVSRAMPRALVSELRGLVNAQVALGAAAQRGQQPGAGGSGSCSDSDSDSSVLLGVDKWDVEEVVVGGAVCYRLLTVSAWAEGGSMADVVEELIWQARQGVPIARTRAAAGGSGAQQEGAEAEAEAEGEEVQAAEEEDDADAPTVDWLRFVRLLLQVACILVVLEQSALVWGDFKYDNIVVERSRRAGQGKAAGAGAKAVGVQEVVKLIDMDDVQRLPLSGEPGLAALHRMAAAAAAAAAGEALEAAQRREAAARAVRCWPVCNAVNTRLCCAPEMVLSMLTKPQGQVPSAAPSSVASTAVSPSASSSSAEALSFVDLAALGACCQHDFPGLKELCKHLQRCAAARGTDPRVGGPVAWRLSDLGEIGRLNNGRAFACIASHVYAYGSCLLAALSLLIAALERAAAARGLAEPGEGDWAVVDALDALGDACMRLQPGERPAPEEVVARVQGILGMLEAGVWWV